MTAYGLELESNHMKHQALFSRIIKPSGLLLLAVASILTLPARADLLEVSMQTTTVSPGSTGNSFDLLLKNISANDVTVGGFSIGLSTANPNFTFTEADSSTSTPYLFEGNSFFGPAIGFPVTAQWWMLSDLALNPGTGRKLAPGEAVGLGRVHFDVSPAEAGGAYWVSLDASPFTSFSDELGTDITDQVTLPSDLGQIIATPEPGSVVLLCTLLCAAGFGPARKRYGAALRDRLRRS